MKIFMKMLCPVCFGTASEPHFGALVCRACAAFFRRRVMSKRAARCTNNGNCEISDNRENFNCKFCRMEKCLRAGMRIEHVQGHRDRHDNSKPARDKTVYPWCYQTLNISPTPFPNFRLALLQTNFSQLLKSRTKFFPKKKQNRGLHLAEALPIFQKDVVFAATWIRNTFPELKLLDDSQQNILFRNFYMKFTIFEPAFLAILLGKPKTYHLPTGDTVDEVSRYYTKHLINPPKIDLNEVSRLFNPYWSDFRATLIDPVIRANITINEFLLLCAVSLWDIGLVGQNKKCELLCDSMRQKIYKELAELCQHSPFRMAEIMLLLPAIQRGVDVYEEELRMGGLYRFLVTENTDDWYKMVGGPI